MTTTKSNPTEFTILRVGDLRRLIDGLDDATHVLVWDESQHHWRNVASVARPDDDMYTALSLELGEPMDSRQF